MRRNVTPTATVAPPPSPTAHGTYGAIAAPAPNASLGASYARLSRSADTTDDARISGGARLVTSSDDVPSAASTLLHRTSGSRWPALASPTIFVTTKSVSGSSTSHESCSISQTRWNAARIASMRSDSTQALYFENGMAAPMACSRFPEEFRLAGGVVNTSISRCGRHPRPRQLDPAACQRGGGDRVSTFVARQVADDMPRGLLVSAEARPLAHQLRPSSGWLCRRAADWFGRILSTARDQPAFQ
jgi:hypothetical protein